MTPVQQTQDACQPWRRESIQEHINSSRDLCIKKIQVMHNAGHSKIEDIFPLLFRVYCPYLVWISYPDEYTAWPGESKTRQKNLHKEEL
jgi:hypothetical protein